ncbi:MAG: DNA repair protein RecO [Clostridia bacterium]|nr:DNA repair protein RecO [Clostridia bacterium]
MGFSTDGLVIKEMNIGDNDRLVTIMTRDYGVIKAFAVGAKSIKSRRGSATGLLSYSDFDIDKKGDTYKIREATVNRMFFGAGSDIDVLALSQYLCELCLVLGPYDENGEEFLRLILNSLHFITEKKRPLALIKAITELRIASISGYTPNLVACDGCGEFEADVMYFNTYEGVLYCENCRKGEYCKEINPAVLKAMRHIVYSKLESLYSFEIPERETKILSDITEKYITLQTEHKFTTLDFYNSII